MNDITENGIMEVMLHELERTIEDYNPCLGDENTMRSYCGCVDSCMMSCADEAY